MWHTKPQGCTKLVETCALRHYLTDKVFVIPSTCRFYGSLRRSMEVPVVRSGRYSVSKRGLEISPLALSARFSTNSETGARGKDSPLKSMDFDSVS